MNRADLAESILAKFCAAIPKHIAEITDVAVAGDLARTASLAHALKGATANLGAERAWQALRLLETAAKGGTPRARRWPCGRPRCSCKPCWMHQISVPMPPA
jgi:HPt (histidine-containing phosphotransfer) domain-containing protein